MSTWAVWATKIDHALIDYEVYLHKAWFVEGDTRLGEAHAPGPVPKRTKGQQAAEMLRRLLAGPARPSAVAATGDEVYGNSPHLRRGLYDAGLTFVLACATMIELRERLGDDPAPEPLSLPETAHLVALLVLTARHTAALVLAWSTWRRRRNKSARICHYRRRAPDTMTISLHGWSTNLQSHRSPRNAEFDAKTDRLTFQHT